MQIMYKEHLIIIDTGFGVSNLGEQLMGRILKNKEELTIHIFFTHFHWDHVQGLPFFHPIYFPSTTLNLYTPVATEAEFKDALNILFDGTYSPFAGIDSMPSKIRYHCMSGPTEIDGLKVSFARCDHGDLTLKSGGTYAYCFEADGGSIAIATDHEAQPSACNDALVKFAEGRSILVHDAQFVAAEYAKRQGWGHSTVEQALANARRINAGLTILTHHDPDRNDHVIYGMEEQFARLPENQNLKFVFAQEGKIYQS